MSSNTTSRLKSFVMARSLGFCSFLFVLAVVSLQSCDGKPQGNGKLWGLLVAGSNGWYNYRHQADICHAYQVLHSHGIPDENIVVMMYDDIAHNSRNPTPGIIINKPNGPDVYHGVLKDYTGKDVTPENFLNILQGRASQMEGIGSGKVIASGPDDHVFVYFSDHGAPGIVAFPTSELHASDLNAAISSMYEKKKFAQMVVYIEACESGSMFYGQLKSNINVFATTASNRMESSYAVYYDAKRGTYLGDVYSVKWLEDSDKKNLRSETLQDQFLIVKRETNTSHVQEFGDMDMENEALSLFQGSKIASNETKATGPSSTADAVPSPDAYLSSLENMFKATGDKKRQAKLLDLMKLELATRSKIRATVKHIVSKLMHTRKGIDAVMTAHPVLGNTDCYKLAVTRFSHSCFKFSKYEYALRQIYVLGNICDMRIPTIRVLEAIDQVCQ